MLVWCIYLSDGLRESYSKMFSLPRKELQAILLIMLLTALYFVAVNLFEYLSIILFVISTFIPLTILILPQDKRILNLKRTLFLSILIVSSILFYLATLLALKIHIFAVGIFIVLGLLFMVFSSTIDKHLGFSVFLVFIIGELIFLGLSIRTTFELNLILLTKLNAILTVYIIFIYYTFIYGNKSCLGNTTVSGFEFLKAYLFLHFRDRNDMLKSIFERASLERAIPIHYTIFVSEKPELAIISAPIHPGPLRNCGSSNLPYFLYNEMKNMLGCETIFLKGAGSHDSNISSTHRTQEFVKSLAKSIAESANSQCSDSMPFPQIIKSGIIKGIIMDTCSNRYLLLTSHPEPTDDIDVNLGYMALEIGRKAHKELVIVDMHNSLTVPEEGKKMNIDDPGYSDMLSAIASSITLETKESYAIAVGAARGTCEGIGLYEGLGPLGIVVSVFDIGNKRFFLVEYDSNNITPDFHENVVSLLKKEFNADLVAVVSTDTHMVTGITHKTMYTILGQLEKERILECTRSVAKEAYSKKKKVKIISGHLTLTTKVLGVDAHHQLLSIATEGVKASNKLFKTTMILLALSTVIALL